MARIPEITSRDALAEDKRPIFDGIMASRGKIAGPFPVLLNSPEVAGRVAHLGAYLRFESVLPRVDLELAIGTAAREQDCEVEWRGHSRLAREAGAREEAIEVIAQKGGLDQLTGEEALIVGFARELARTSHVSDATFEAAKARYGVQGVTELTAAIGYYTMLAFVLNTLT